MSHYFTNGHRTPALDAAYLNSPGDRPMPKTPIARAAQGKASALRPTTGIFGPNWPQWRGATLRVELDGEEPFIARLEEIRAGDPKTARLSVLNPQGQPIDVRTVPWPPAGTVRVVRAP